MEMIAYGPQIRHGFSVGNIYDQSVLHDRTTYRYLKIAVRDGLVIDLQIDYAVVVLQDRLHSRRELALKVIVPLLKVLRREEHALIPDYLSVFAHRQGSCK
jgi:hypothetical protein